LSKEFPGYKGKALRILKKAEAEIGDIICITKDRETYEGVLIPRSEYGDDEHIVIKLKSGYNTGIKLTPTTQIKKIGKGTKPTFTPPPLPKQKPNLPKVAIISTGGTIASRVDYRTGAVRPALSGPRTLPNRHHRRRDSLQPLQRKHHPKTLDTNSKNSRQTHQKRSSRSRCRPRNRHTSIHLSSTKLRTTRTTHTSDTGWFPKISRPPQLRRSHKPHRSSQSSLQCSLRRSCHRHAPNHLRQIHSLSQRNQSQKMPHESPRHFQVYKCNANRQDGRQKNHHAN